MPRGVRLGYTGRLAGTRPRFDAMSYAIISLGGKQYRVQEGERLLVDRLPTEEGKTFHPEVLMLGGDGAFELAPKGVQVTAKVVGARARTTRSGSASPSRRGLPPAHRLPRQALADRDPVDRQSGERSAPKKDKEAPGEGRSRQGRGRHGAAGRVRRHDGQATSPRTLGGWSAAQVAAALEYERAHANRKGALAALEAQEEKS